jgi:uncharacterized protein involved in exopolysaccharide biosynthesis/Mrp family chromosome partitioning ATPase
MTVGDILYVIFRHKWKIVLISGVGIAVAGVLPLLRPIPYESEAKLLIKYVLETKIPGQLTANEPGVRPIDAVESVINAELEILTSLDLAQQVASNVGAERVLAKAGGGTNPLAAAFLIKKNLVADVPKRGNVIRIVFQHPNGEIAQTVLGQVLEAYHNKHREMHGDVSNYDEDLQKQAEDYRLRLEKTEEDLRIAKAKAGVISLDDSREFYTGQLSKLRQEVDDAKVKLAEHQASFEKLEELLNTSSAIATNSEIATNNATIPIEKLTEYRKVCDRLNTLEKKEQEYLTGGYKPESSFVASIREQIAANEKFKKQLVDEYPGLLAVRISEPQTAFADPISKLRTDLITEIASISMLNSRIKELNRQLDDIRKEATILSDAEGSIKDLEETRESLLTRYKIDTEYLARSRIVALGAGKQWNIRIIQAPSPASPAASKLYKMMAMALFGGIGAAIALAFLIELYVDRSLKRPIEVETKLGLPLFISIPRMKLNGKLGDLMAERKIPLLSQSVGGTEELDHLHQAEAGSSNQTLSRPATAEVAPWEANHELRPFSEALRDRLITYFEVNNVTRKPKLVAVTSCAEGSGVSTVAAGLAASLSETGDGKVLLVDMNGKTGDTHHFFKGQLTVLDEAIELETRDNALVQDNLYVATEPMDNDNLPRVMPKRFKNLVGRMHASDFDYIIFDMPQVSQVSVTPRLARFMDMVLLVVESEKTDRDVVKRASTMLSESKANVSVVLNKEQAHVPKWLQQG